MENKALIFESSSEEGYRGTGRYRTYPCPRVRDRAGGTRYGGSGKQRSLPEVCGYGCGSNWRERVCGCLKAGYHEAAARRVPGGSGVYKISYNIIISYRIFSD